MLARRGFIVDSRFELQDTAGAGGMGTVWRAVDQRSDELVALKLLRAPRPDDVARFTHEARILSTLEHPHIVRCVAHGLLPDGEPYLAMEWLDGRDLGDRLEHGGLTMAETLEMIRRIAQALATAHAHDIIHRDIKPSNLFLESDDPSKVKLLDFGVARLSNSTRNLTRTGSVLGTPGYMAPEQARGERRIGPAADVFSLGCVMFECLTGQPAFQGTHVMALLAKLLLEQQPDIAELRPEIPLPLADLVGRMLDKNPTLRPADGAAVEAALTSLELPTDDVVVRRAVPSGITGTERRLVSLVIAVPSSPNPGAEWADIEAVRNIAERFAATLEVLASGALIVMLAGVGAPTDQATAAAKCGLEMRAALPGASMALLTARSETNLRLPIGDVLEQAMLMLAAIGSERIAIDEVTHSLLDTRFELIEDGERWLLAGERPIGEEPRRLLGRPSPFVGRDRELRFLREQLEDGFAQPAAQATLITGPAGIGKSRMRQELLRQLADSTPGLTCGVGRTDSQGAGAPLASLASALRSALRISSGQAIEQQRAELAAIVTRLATPDDAQRIADFVGELLNLPFASDNNPRLQAARQNPRIMAAQIESACIDFLRALAAKHPTLLVLEDLHWGDSASVRLLDVALRELEELPFAVMAFARPEIHDLFPKLWSGRSFTELRLNNLHRRAAQQLITSVLGDAIAEHRVTSIIERAGGNAFYLEELIRAVAAGRDQTLPDSVLGMVEARLDVLSNESRKLLRAASIFGEYFWLSGLRALLDEPDWSIATMIDELVTQEFLRRRTSSRFAEQEYAFRHALVREGAYAMLTERDRTLGHKLVGEWLEGAGELEAVVLATHFELGAEPQKSARWRMIAAEQTLRSGDPMTALAATDRALELAPDGDVPEQLWAIRAEAGMMTGGRGLAVAIAAAKETLRVIKPGSQRFGQALHGGIGAALLDHDIAATESFFPVLLTVEPDPGQVSAIAPAFPMLVAALTFAGQRDPAKLYVDRINSLADADDNPTALAHAAIASAHWEFWGPRNPWASMQAYSRAQQLFEVTGDRLNERATSSWLILCHAALGAFEQADELSTKCELRPQDRDMTLQGVVAHTTYSLVERGDYDRAIHYARAAFADGCMQFGNVPYMIAILLVCEALIACGEIDEAARELERSSAAAMGLWITDNTVIGLRAKILLARNQPAAATREAELALTRARETGVSEWFRFASTLLLRAEAHQAAGDAGSAKRAIAEARDDLLTRASWIVDLELRRSFLERVPTHARTLALANEWLGAG